MRTVGSMAGTGRNRGRAQSLAHPRPGAGHARAALRRTRTQGGRLPWPRRGSGASAGPRSAGWFVVLLVQSALVGIGRTDLHRALGRIGAVLVGARLVPRRDVQSHKRLMLIGSIAIINAALARWPVVFESGGPVLRFVLAARLL